jgi:hypothetical protein
VHRKSATPNATLDNSTQHNTTATLDISIKTAAVKSF